MQTQAIRFKSGWYIKELPGFEDIPRDAITVDVTISEQDGTELDYKQLRGLAAMERYTEKRNREELREGDIARNLQFRKKYGIISTTFSEAIKAL